MTDSHEIMSSVFEWLNIIEMKKLLRHGLDFKQALSTLERLQQEAGNEPHVPTYSYKHK